MKKSYDKLKSKLADPMRDIVLGMLWIGCLMKCHQGTIIQSKRMSWD